MVGADDEIVWPFTGNDDLIAAGLAPEDDDDTREDAAALFGIDVGSGPVAPIDLDSGTGEGATTTGTPVCSNGSTPSVAGNTSGAGIGKRKYAVWTDFDEVYETVMVGKYALKLPVKCVSILCLLDLMLALAT
jgi:hypothetical protein